MTRFGLHTRTLLFALVAMVVGVIASDHSSAEVSIEILNCGGKCTPPRLFVQGEISGQTIDEFKARIADSRIVEAQKLNPVSVRLSSPGGSVLSAMELGDLIRDGGYSTAVFGPDECESACVLVLVAGVTRVASYGRIGIHRPHFPEELFAALSRQEARQKYESMSASVKSYLSRMGMPDTLYRAMLAVASDDIRFLSPQQIKDYGLEGEDPAWAEWRRARLIDEWGADQYQLVRIEGRLLAACTNRLGSIDKCSGPVRAKLKALMKACEGSSDVAACVEKAAR